MREEIVQMSKDRLYRKIRNAENPNNPELIRQYLTQTPLLEPNTKEACRAHLVKQFKLILDTVADDYLPAHWRCLCLDHIYLPLHALQRLADCKQSKRQLVLLSNELRVISHYFQAGLQAEPIAQTGN